MLYGDEFCNLKRFSPSCYAQMINLYYYVLQLQIYYCLGNVVKQVLLSDTIAKFVIKTIAEGSLSNILN